MMNETTIDQIKLQLTQHLEQQSASTLAVHRWMKRLEVASLGIIAAIFILALYVSITWKAVPKMAIPTAWFAFAGSACISMVLIGLHAILLRAFPPVILPGNRHWFTTGREAPWLGGGLVLGGLAYGAFWGTFAYATATFNLALLEPLMRTLGIVLGAGMGISILFALIQSFSRSFSRSR
jgi:hypothetical protein